MADVGIRLGVEGEKDFKQALSDINKNFKVLGSEMKLVASQFEKNDNSIGALSSRNEVLNKQIDAQKNKIETLRAALKNASESFGENDKRTKNWQIQLNNAEASLNKMERELKDNQAQMNKTGDAADKMGDEIKRSGKQADDSRSGFESLKSTLSTVGAALGATIAAIGTAAVAAGKKIWDMANDTAEAGDVIDKGSQKVGLSAESYQKWDYAMRIAGTSMSDCETGLKTLTNTIDDAQQGSAGAINKFERLGISLDDIKGKSREEIFDVTIKALQDVSDDTEKAALANDMFGKSGQNLLPLLNQTSDETAKVIAEAEKYGMVMSDDAVKASAAFEDSLTKLKGTFNGVKNSIMSQLLPGFTAITDGFSELVSGNKEGSEMIKNGIENVIETVTDMIPQVVSLLTTIGEAILEEAPSVLESLSSSIIDLLPGALDFALNDVLPNLVSSALSIAGQLLTSLSEALPDLMISLAESFSAIVTDLFSEENITGFVQLLLDFIKNALAGIGEALPIILEAIKNVALNLIDALPEIFSMILGTIPDLIDNISLIIKNGLPVLVQGAIELISSICQNLPLILEQLFENLPRILESISSALTDNLPILIQCGIDLAKGLVVNLPKITLGLLKAAPGILLSIAKALLTEIGSIIDVGKNIVKGLWEGITGAAAWLWDKITGWMKGIWDGIKNFFGIHSPSTKMRDMIGKNLVKGLAEGIVDEGKTAVNAMTALSKDLGAVTFSPITFKGITDDLSGAIPSDFDSQMRASVLTASQYDGGARVRSVSPTFNTNVTFGNVTINDGSDVEDIAHRVSDIITNDVMVKGGAFA